MYLLNRIVRMRGGMEKIINTQKYDVSFFNFHIFINSKNNNQTNLHKKGA